MSATTLPANAVSCFPAGLLIDQTAADSEEMKELAAFWHIEQTQIEPGSYSGRVRACHTTTVQVGHSMRSRGTRIDGTAPAGTVVLGVELPSQHATYFRNGRLENHEIAVIRAGEEIAVTEAGPSGHLTVAIAEPLLDGIADLYGCRSFAALCPGDRLVVEVADGAAGIARRLVALLEERFQPGRVFHANEERDFQLDALAVLFANVRSPRNAPPAPERRRIARRAANYLREHAHRPLALVEVCQAVTTAPRTLELGFSETFGISPKAYVQALRFNGVHRELLAADPTDASVKAIALDWGFNHLGRFAIEYRRWFGESPSGTINRAR